VIGMRKVLTAIGFALVTMGAASADTLGVVKENTLTLTDEKGRATAYLFSADGTFEQSTATSHASGKWSLRDTGQLCYQAETSSSIACLPALPADKGVGDEWEMKAPSGRFIYAAKIVEGRIRLDPAE
jgi:hypothetical protein